MKDSRTKAINWNKVGYITAAILLIPSLITAVCVVKTDIPLFIASMTTAFWAEYKLGFFKYPVD